ncbi:MAG: NosD domain-containing protein, partial [Methanosarcinales archaeon]
SQYCTGSDPYPYTGGDWVITGETICEDEEYINVTGNITIQSGGTLNLINSTVALENLANTSNFTNFDNLYMNDSSNITTNASNIYFWMSIESGADFQSNDSFIERAGYSGKESLKISNPLTCYIDNTTFYPLENQVNIIGDCTLYDSNITSSTYTLNLTNAWGNYSQNYIKALDNDALWLKNVNDSTIDNNEIYASGSGEYAVQLKLLTWLNDTNFTNNYLKSTSDGYSFYASSGKLFNDRFINNDFYGGTETFYHNGYGKDLNFTSNEFWKIGSTTYAVMDLRTNNSHILNNTFYNSTGYTLSLSTTFHNNITNNTFIGTTSNEYAVAIYSGENNTFFDNNITSNGYGLYIGDSNDFVLNNDLKSDDLTLYIYSGSDSNNISWNWLEATGTDKNASFIWSSNNLFKNNSFYSPGGSAIMMFEGNNNSFYEDILTSLSARYDYYANGTGTNYFYDVDFDKSKTGFEDTSKLKVYWSVIANVTDDSGTPIQDANVTAYNVSDIDVWWNLTNATGFTNWTYLEEYNENATNKYFQTNYTFNATKDTYESTQEIINLTYAGTQVNITLTIPFVADTSYTILMPDTYDFPYEYNITAPTEAEANVTDWISFNYSLPFPNYWVQPYAGGNPTRNQNGISQPIFLIDNIGNVNISIYLRYNESLQSGITLSFNASCYPSGYCTFVQTSEKLLTNSYSLVANNISTSSFLNITLWSNYTGSLTGGEYESNILTKANETNP